MLRLLPLIVIACFSPACLAQVLQPQGRRGPIPDIERVLIISVDGLRPDVLMRADTPNMHRLIEHGAFTFWARTTAQGITLPSHVSMLTGVTPEAHAILWNAELRFKEPVYPDVPTLFELAKQAHLTTGMSVGKNKFLVLDKPGALDWKFLVPPLTAAQQLPNQHPIDGVDEQVADHAADIVREHSPHVMFVHLPNVDAWGHYAGWGSDAQMKAVAEADRCVGLVLRAEADAKLVDSTLVILTSDHGGAGRTHGPEDARSRSIPWIVSGPHVRENFDLTLLAKNNDVQTFDTFSTACGVLGLHWPVTDPVVGKFIVEAFDTQELMLSTYEPKMIPSTNPTTLPATQPAAVAVH